jgi:hypothetical protein
MPKYPMISYPEVRQKFIKETGSKLWDENGNVTKEYLQWLENYVLNNQQLIAKS